MEECARGRALFPRQHVVASILLSPILLGLLPFSLCHSIRHPLPAVSLSPSYKYLLRATPQRLTQLLSIVSFFECVAYSSFSIVRKQGIYPAFFLASGNGAVLGVHGLPNLLPHLHRRAAAAARGAAAAGRRRWRRQAQRRPGRPPGGVRRLRGLHPRRAAGRLLPARRRRRGRPGPGRVLPRRRPPRLGAGPRAFHQRAGAGARRGGGGHEPQLARRGRSRTRGGASAGIAGVLAGAGRALRGRVVRRAVDRRAQLDAGARRAGAAVLGGLPLPVRGRHPLQRRPQISNVYELDVVTGKGETVTCSETTNPDLFFGALGGLGQFGIITRARIALEPAPRKVRWIRALYSNFTEFTADQERLIAQHGGRRFDYVEGFVVAAEGLINNWRSSFFSPQNPVKLSSLKQHTGVLYCLEVTKNYDDSTAATVDQEVDALLGDLNFLPGTVFTTDLPYVDFLDRVHKAELKLRGKGMWEVPHPWLNLFVPASRIHGILGSRTSGGPILICPMNKHKCDPRSSVVSPDEDVFYLVAFLRSALPGAPQSLEELARQNRQILDFCAEAGIGAKQYLPNHKSQPEWKAHFGPKRWARLANLKAEFDPKAMLATGQGIFRSPPLLSDS